MLILYWNGIYMILYLQLNKLSANILVKGVKSWCAECVLFFHNPSILVSYKCKYNISWGFSLFKLYRIDLGSLDNVFIKFCNFFVAPSGSPTNVHCQSRSPNSILLEWSKPKREERNGIIRGYWIEYYPRTLWYGK